MMTTRDVIDLETAFAYFKQEWDAGRYVESDGELYLMMSGEPGRMGNLMAAYAKSNPRPETQS